MNATTSHFGPVWYYTRETSRAHTTRRAVPGRTRYYINTWGTNRLTKGRVQRAFYRWFIFRRRQRRLFRLVRPNVSHIRGLLLVFLIRFLPNVARGLFRWLLLGFGHERLFINFRLRSL